eukprot:730255_1
MLSTYPFCSVPNFSLYIHSINKQILLKKQTVSCTALNRTIRHPIFKLFSVFESLIFIIHFAPYFASKTRQKLSKIWCIILIVNCPTDAHNTNRCLIKFNPRSTSPDAFLCIACTPPLLSVAPSIPEAAVWTMDRDS